MGDKIEIKLGEANLVKDVVNCPFVASLSTEQPKNLATISNQQFELDRSIVTIVDNVAVISAEKVTNDMSNLVIVTIEFTGWYFSEVKTATLQVDVTAVKMVLLSGARV